MHSTTRDLGSRKSSTPLAEMRVLLLAVLLNLGRTVSLDALRGVVRSYAQAAQCCAAVAVRPGESAGWQSLGTLLYGKGRLEAARVSLERARELSRGADAQVQLDLANVLRTMGKFDDARRCLRAAQAITGTPNQAVEYGGPGPHTELPSPPAFEQLAPSGVWRTSIASADECDWVIRTAEEHAAKCGGWGNPPPR